MFNKNNRYDSIFNFSIILVVSSREQKLFDSVLFTAKITEFAVSCFSQF